MKHILNIFLMTFILISCSNDYNSNNNMVADTLNWDEKKISLINNVDDSEFSDYEDGIYFTRTDGTSGIIGEWTRQTTSTAVINGMRITYHPETKTVKYYENGTYSVNASNKWPNDSKTGFLGYSGSATGKYILYNFKGDYRIIIKKDGESTEEKNNYFVSDNYLYVEELSDMAKREENEKRYEVKYEKISNTYNETIKAITEAEDYTKIKINGEVTPAYYLHDMYAAISNTRKLLVLDYTNVLNFTKYPEINSFYDYYIFSINLSQNTSELESNAFARLKNLQSIRLSDSITEISYNCFYECTSLHEIILPSALQSIGVSAFLKSGLRSIEIPESVTSIGNQAFWGCELLRTVKLHSTTPPMLGDTVFTGTKRLTIFVPESSVNIYKNATGWQNYSSKIKGY